MVGLQTYWLRSWVYPLLTSDSDIICTIIMPLSALNCLCFFVFFPLFFHYFSSIFNRFKSPPGCYLSNGGHCLTGHPPPPRSSTHHTPHRNKRSHCKHLYAYFYRFR